MELILALLLLSPFVAFGVMLLIWKRLGKRRPLLSGLLNLVFSIIPIIFVASSFNIDPFSPSFGIFIIGPTYVVTLLGIGFFIVGFVTGLRKLWPELIQLIKDIRHGQRN